MTPLSPTFFDTNGFQKTKSGYTLPIRSEWQGSICSIEARELNGKWFANYLVNGLWASPTMYSEEEVKAFIEMVRWKPTTRKS